MSKKRNRHKHDHPTPNLEGMKRMPQSNNTKNGTHAAGYLQYDSRNYAAYGGSCHVGPKKVMEIGKAFIFAGSKAELRDDWAWNLMIRITDDLTPLAKPEVVAANSVAQEELPAGLVKPAFPAVIDIMWDDFGVPFLDKAWWQLLYETIKSWPERKDVVIHCLGGHGRTGTALAILAGLNGDPDPVKMLREVYCKKIVESQSQIAYIEKMTGLDLSKTEPYDIMLRAPIGYRTVGAKGSNHIMGMEYIDGKYQEVEWEPIKKDNGIHGRPMSDDMPDIPLDTDGEPDWDKMTADQIEAYIKYEAGQENL
jgi:hypothetical protein